MQKIDESYIEKLWEQKEVREFFQAFKKIRKGVQAAFEAPLSVSEVILDAVETYSRLLPHVSQYFFKGKPCRVIVGADVTKAEFKADDEAASASSFGVDVEFENYRGYKAIKVIFISNEMLDSYEEMDSIILVNLCKAIAMAVDDAILNGQGSASNQLDGIIPNLPAENLKTVVGLDSDIYQLAQHIVTVDSGIDNQNEIVAIVNRDTYYSKLMNALLKCPNPECLPKFVFCSAMPHNKVLFSDFSKYILIKRSGLSIETSKNVRFLGAETGYKGKMNFDGKPARPQAFVLVTLSDS